MARFREFSRECSSKVVNDVLHKPFTLQAITGVMVQYCLGCGANGCAFRVADSLVLKVSTHPGEAPIAKTTQGLGRVWPFLPIFHGAWIVPGSTFDQPALVQDDATTDEDALGITLREDLIDFTPDHPKQFIARASRFLDEAMSADTPADIRELRRHLASRLDDMTSFDAKAVRMLADFALWSKHYDLGFDLEEFSGSLAITNLGQSLEDDAVVIRDLGNLSPEEGSLLRLRRATLQRAREGRS